MPADELKYWRTAGGQIRASANGVGPGSILVAERVASFYSRQLSSIHGVVADLGCGNAPLRPAYEPLATQVVTIDWPGSPHQIQPDVAANISEGVPLRSGSVDVVVLSDVLEHLADPLSALKECCRVLRDGGSLVGNMPFMYWVHEAPHDYQRFTQFGLLRNLAEAGFADVSVMVLGGGMDVVVDIAAKLLAGLGPAGRLASRAIQRAWLVLARVRLVAALNARVQDQLPLAYGFVGRVG